MNNDLHHLTMEFQDRAAQSWYGQNNQIMLKLSLDNTHTPFYIIKLY